MGPQKRVRMKAALVVVAAACLVCALSAPVADEKKPAQNDVGAEIGELLRSGEAKKILNTRGYVLDEAKNFNGEASLGEAGDACSKVCGSACRQPSDAKKPQCAACAQCHVDVQQGKTYKATASNEDLANGNAECKSVCGEACKSQKDVTKPACASCAQCHEQAARKALSETGGNPCQKACGSNCVTQADASKPECHACAKCHQANGDTGDGCVKVCGSQCKSEADAGKPACKQCLKCHNHERMIVKMLSPKVPNPHGFAIHEAPTSM